MTLSRPLDEITWLGHASFRIRSSNKVIYIDPWELKATSPAADIILITHPHYDHFSAADIEKISKPDTVITGPRDCRGKLKLELKVVAPGDVLDIGGVKIQAVAAYNKNKNFHPRGNNWVGYLIEAGGVKIYHAGDSDAVPEMEGLKGVDYLLVPIGGTYTMDAAEAADVEGCWLPAGAALTVISTSVEALTAL